VAWEFFAAIRRRDLGHFADRYFRLVAWGLITCTLLGSCTGLYRMIVTLKHFERRDSMG